jgi:hypothetical protein
MTTGPKDSNDFGETLAIVGNMLKHFRRCTKVESVVRVDEVLHILTFHPFDAFARIHSRKELGYRQVAAMPA